MGGAFIRSESGRVVSVYRCDDKTILLGNVPRCTRKDVRNAVEAAGSAGPGWSKRSGYNRGQILYRLAEMVESRADEMAASIIQSTGVQAEAASAEVAVAIDRLIYYAGWADKYAQVAGNTNPVAGPYFNFTLPEPMGVIGVLAEDGAPSLLGLVSQVAPIVAGGNTTVAFVSAAAPLPAILLGEMLAVSDLPAGVINLLTGKREEVLSTFATHEGLRAVDAAGVSEEERQTLGTGAARSVKRLKLRSPGEVDWLSKAAQGLEEIVEFVEYKTVWHPIGA